MFLLHALADLIMILFRIYYWMIIGYILMSWVPNARESIVGEWLGRLVEPYLSPFRRIIPPIGGMLDISPIVALIVLHFMGQGASFILATLLRL